mmetsp:Transcript_31517/g.81984  ORF Transcript_31517/g.81984 Transcript_31517/m.81984 type:complete len:81 (-) Transcript_31517:95-337(-)
MSEDEMRRKRLKKGHSNVEYKANKPHGLANRFQPSWLKDPNCPLREHWLRDDGLDSNNECGKVPLLQYQLPEQAPECESA